MKLCRNPHNPGPTSVARVVAKAMADQGPAGEVILQKSALLQVKSLISHKNTTLWLGVPKLHNLSLTHFFFFFKQEELNSSDCGWALLVTESDPHVLSCLLWTWLDKLRVSCIK